MVLVSNADRVVFPEVNSTKGDVVAYYERIAPRALPHVVERPLSIRRYPKGVAAPGFFQKNVPPHWPESIARFEIPRSDAAAKRRPRKGATDAGVTMYPLVETAEHLAYMANQGAIELHITAARAPDLQHPDRLVIDLDPPSGAFDKVRRAAHLARALLLELGLETTPVATGSKGYHLVAAIQPLIDVWRLGETMLMAATLLAAKHPDELTTVFRIAGRGERVFVDWLRNYPNATCIAPYSLRARARATVAVPLAWDEIDARDPDAFGIDDLERLVERPDPLAELARRPTDPNAFVAAVEAAFVASGLKLEVFDRFRS